MQVDGSVETENIKGKHAYKIFSLHSGNSTEVQKETKTSSFKKLSKCAESSG